MKQTEHYQLSQWESTDRILMEDFNGDNAKIDAALQAGADAREALAQAVAKCGNCRLYMTTYIGNGLQGAENPMSLTFPKPPLVLFISDKNFLAYYIRGHKLILDRNTIVEYETTLSDDGCTITWEQIGGGGSSSILFNADGTTYYVTALLQAD